MSAFDILIAICRLVALVFLTCCVFISGSYIGGFANTFLKILGSFFMAGSSLLILMADDE